MFRVGPAFENRDLKKGEKKKKKNDVVKVAKAKSRGTELGVVVLWESLPLSQERGDAARKESEESTEQAKSRGGKKCTVG